MKKHIVFCFTCGTLILRSYYSSAQQKFGQIVLNAGVGYSPEFDGEMGFNNNIFPVGIDPAINEYNGYFDCSTISPNIGGAIDFGISRKCSVGLALNYQSEMVSWTPSNEIISDFFDKVTRTNIAGRFLYHLNKENNQVDPYVGVRTGISVWQDIPSSGNYLSGSTNIITFINLPNLLVPSLQVLFGVHLYLNRFVGAFVETGIGSPYLFAGGLTVRINGGEQSMKSKQPPALSNSPK